MTQPDVDILSRGPDTPRRRPNARVIVGVVAGVVALLIWRLVSTQPAPTDAVPTPPPPTVASRPATASPPVSAASAATASAHRLPLPPRDVLPLGEATGARLVLSGSNLIDIALDTGEVTTTAVSGPILQAIRIRDGDVLLVADAATGTRRAVFAASDRAAEALLGPARAIVPAADDEHVWVEAPSEPGLPKILSKVSRTGQVIATANLGPWRAAIRETAYGMLTISNSYFSQSLELWDIARSQVAATYWVAASLLVVAASTTHSAFVLPNCDLLMCPIKLVDVRRAEVLDLPMPQHWEPNAAAFSPDGMHLAVLGRQLHRGVAGDPALVDFDLRRMRSRTVPGVEVLTSRSSLLAWSPDSQWFFAAAGPDVAPLLGYRLGDPRVRYVPFPRTAGGLDSAELRSLSAH